MLGVQSSWPRTLASINVVRSKPYTSMLYKADQYICILYNNITSSTIPFQVDQPAVCQGLAVVTHYFVLGGLLWLAVGGHHVLTLMTVGCSDQDTIFLCKRCIFAWGESINSGRISELLIIFRL